MKILIYFILISIIIYVNSSKCNSGDGRTFLNCVNCMYGEGCTKCDPGYYLLVGHVKNAQTFVHIVGEKMYVENVRKDL